MTNQGTSLKTAFPESNPTYVLGFYTSIFTAVLTLVTFGIAILTPPLAGPFCASSSCFEYPYTDIASRFPRDYLWMYPAILLTLGYVVLMVCLHHYASQEKKVFSQIGLSFALISATALVIDYFVQVSVIQPSLLNGETDGIPILSQYNPHGVFIALEEVGYLIMSVSFFCVAPIFSSRSRLERAVRWTFIISFFLMIISFVLISISYGIYREYRFEVAAITIDWLALIIAGIPLSFVFKRAKTRTPR
jgi:hypothetical protein